VIINQGVSFGLNVPGVEIISIMFLLVIIYLWSKDRQNGYILMLLGGGLNLISRLWWGGVVDYWKIPLTNVYNNLNDYLIFIGVVWVIINKWKKSK
jgi:lipoprotein signal peptidase